MKKTLSVILSLALLMGACAALAETPAKEALGTIGISGAFDLQCRVPEGYQLQIPSKDEQGLIARLSSEDASKPYMMLVIEFEEQFADVKRLNDLSDGEKQMIIDTFTDGGDEVSVSYRETSHGTQLMVVKENEDAIDFVSFLTVYEGYMIEFDLIASEQTVLEGQGLTEEQIQICVDFLSDLDFIPAAE